MRLISSYRGFLFINLNKGLGLAIPLSISETLSRSTQHTNLPGIVTSIGPGKDSHHLIMSNAYQKLVQNEKYWTVSGC